MIGCQKGKLVAEDKKLARSFVATDLINLVRSLHERGIQPDVVNRDDVIEDDPHSIIQLIIGHRGNLTGRHAKEAAKGWKLARSQAPRSPIHIAIAGYDQDPSELWEFAEVCRFVRRWARAAGLDDPYVAMREIGNVEQFPNLLVLLAKCGTFGEEYPFEVKLEKPPVTRQCQRPLPAIENVAAAYRDQEKVILVTKDFMLNQLRRDAPRIAGSFDECVGGELDKISELVGKTYGILAPKIIGTSLTERDLTSTSARLLHHAGTTFFGAIHLARGGFRRQYMVLVRSVFETIAVVIRLCADPKALANFYAGSKDSTKAISAANKLFPVFGRIYGMLSNEFVHIGENQAAFERMGDYSKDDEDLKLILTSMKLTAWVMYVATELVFIEFVPRPRYWKIVAHHEDDTRVEVNYGPSEEERRWQAQFLGTAAAIVRSELRRGNARSSSDT
jgi:hypothetical protein